LKLFCYYLEDEKAPKIQIYFAILTKANIMHFHPKKELQNIVASIFSCLFSMFWTLKLSYNVNIWTFFGSVSVSANFSKNGIFIIV